MALAYLTINLDAFTGDDHPPISQYSTITLDPGADHIDAGADVIHVRAIVVSLDRQGKAATANGVPCIDGKVPVVAGVMYAVSAPNVLRDGPHYIPALTAGQVVDLSDYITPGAPLTPDQAATLTARIVALETTPPDHGALTGLNEDDHALYALADGTRGAFAAPLGADDNYVTDAEKAALHGHSNKAALDLVSGTNTGDQVLPTWSTISGKPACVAEGETQADARTAIGAGTSNLTIGTTGTTAAAGNRAATETATGMVELATTTEATTGTDTVRAVTPAGVKAVADTKANVSHTHTASQVSDSTATGRALVTATDAAAARGTLGLATVAATGAYADLSGKPTTMTPTAHAATHAAAGSDPVTLTSAQISDLTETVASTAVLPTRQVIAGTGLTGGGDLSADRTLAVAYGTTAGTAAQGNDSRIVNAVQPGDLVVNVRDFGAVGDGVADDTAAIQAALNATALGGTTFFSAGTYKVTATLTRRRGRRIQGHGYLARVDALTGFGSAGYADPANLTGTIIRSTVTTGTALTLEVGTYNQGGCPIDGVALVGPGTGSAIGYDDGDGTRTVLDAHGGQFAVHNFPTGVRLANVENSSWGALIIRSCTVAGSFITNTNANVFRVDVSRCGTGLTLDSTTVANLLPGFIGQGNLGTSLTVSGYGNRVTCPYFENTSSAGPALAVATGAVGTVVESPSFHSVADDVTIASGAAATQFLTPNVKGGGITVTNAGVGTVLIGDLLTGMAFTDTGTKTNYLDTGAQKSKLSPTLRVGESVGQSVVEVNGSSGNTKSVSFMTAEVLRWIVRSNAIAEGGSNSGSDLEFVARDDAGGSLNTTTIRRTDGRMTHPAAVVTGRYTTAARPAAATVGNGGQVYDTTLSKPIWSDGTSWRDAAGAVV